MDLLVCLPSSLDYTLIGLQKTFCFSDDILIVSKGSEEDHFKLVTNCPKKLDAVSLRFNLPKWHFAKQEISWLGNNIPQTGISPLEYKTSATLSLQPPSTLKNYVFSWICPLYY